MFFDSYWFKLIILHDSVYHRRDMTLARSARPRKMPGWIMADSTCKNNFNFNFKEYLIIQKGLVRK